MESPQGFVEEIDFNELQFHEVVGKGAFGVVSRAKWRTKDVAVKLIETESERKAFITELKQLSRVAHPNIVKLYGACTKQPTVCLVMEYAEGGSLYNVLHGTGPQPHYTSAHSMSWALQCARGVEYLHGMKPKALIHRDLKPPNLLLIMGGTVLKICDFGTACDIQTHMTNNKGSAAWMAPEVFEGFNYSEKCDVFSWGIILWEVFTRKKPFDEIGGPAFRIMWAVHNGTRPPLIRNLPKPLEILMTRCWSGNPVERPSMAEVVRIMSHLYQFFYGAEQTLVYPQYSESESPDYTFTSPSVTGRNYSVSPPSTGNTSSPPTATESRSGTISDTVRQARDRGDVVNLVQHTPPRTTQPVVIEEDQTRGQKSAPASLAASRESLFDGYGRSPRCATPVEQYNKRYSADLTKLGECDIMSQASGGNPQRALGHRRSGSYGTASSLITSGPQIQGQTTAKGHSHRRVGSDEYSQITSESSRSSTPCTGSPAQHASPVHHVSTYPGSLNHVTQGDTPVRAVSPLRSISYQPPASDVTHPPDTRSASWSSERSTPGFNLTHGQDSVARNNTDFAMSLVYQSLDHQLQPLAPCPSSKESMETFEEHCRLAQEYVRVQTDIALLIQRKHELNKEFEQDARDQQSSTRLAEDYTELKKENEGLQLLHQNMKKQVEQIRAEQQKRYGVN
ncbi:hypothetical protein ScPMuIL_012775 [Solemya velum]